MRRRPGSITSMRRRITRIAITLTAAALVAVPPALASRAPSRAESSAIRSAALRTMHGSGWRVSGIRISTVPSTYRYAKASVDNARTGVGGEMILRRKSGHWSRVFLGTDGFCGAQAPRAVLRDLGFGC